jgi:hypothetical protein
LLAGLSLASASVGDRHGVLAGGLKRPAGLVPPPKDCTRINGRYGYYANFWCSESEQRAWDLWEARRRTVPGKG